MSFYYCFVLILIINTQNITSIHLIAIKTITFLHLVINIILINTLIMHIFDNYDKLKMISERTLRGKLFGYFRKEKNTSAFTLIFFNTLFNTFLSYRIDDT